MTKKSNMDLLGRLKELHADSLSITNDREIDSASSRSIFLANDVDEMLTPIPFIVPAQICAALLSEAKGLDPDAPRSLSKVTKTL